jgi:hypothetical protein
MLTISAPTNGQSFTITPPQTNVNINVQGTCSAKHAVTVKRDGTSMGTAQPDPNTGAWSKDIVAAKGGHTISAECPGETNSPSVNISVS